MANIAKITDVTGTTYDLKDNAAISNITSVDLNTFNATRRNGTSLTFDNPAGVAVTELEEYTKDVIREENDLKTIVGEDCGFEANLSDISKKFSCYISELIHDNASVPYVEITSDMHPQNFEFTDIMPLANWRLFSSRGNAVSAQELVNYFIPSNYKGRLLIKINNIEIESVSMTCNYNSTTDFIIWRISFPELSNLAQTDIFTLYFCRSYYTLGYRADSTIGYLSLAEGGGTTASGNYTHAEGSVTTASGSCSHAEGDGTTASGNYTHAEGGVTTASGNCSHAEGYQTTASGDYSHAEGGGTEATGQYSHAEGQNTKATNTGAHAEGFGTKPSGLYSHAEGANTKATNSASHAEGSGTEATGQFSHAEGYATKASKDYSHAEGNSTIASGLYSHAEGTGTTASEDCSHAEGSTTTASGKYSHAQNQYTIAKGNSQTALGKFNVEDLNNEYAIIVGNGTADGSRSNALTLDWDGNAAIAGNITTSGNISGGDISGSTLATTGNISSSGTITANGAISNGSISILSSNLDNTVTPSSNVTGSNHLYLKDKNGTIFTNLYSQKLTSGTTQSVFMNQNGSETNYIAIGTASNGSASYSIKDKAAFRSAIELNRTQTTLTLSNTSAGSCTLVRNAIMATVFLDDIKLSAALASGSSVTLATVPEGYRPAKHARGYLTSTTNGQAPVKWYVNTSGSVAIQNRTSASLATSVVLAGVITYVI